MKNKILKPYETDSSQIKGKATDIFFPKSILETQAFVRINKNICIRGGGSGLAGGAVPQNDVVLDLSKLNNIEKIDTQRKTIEVEAGVILDDLNDYLEKFNLEFPVNPSSHSIATIGGMIATNAVGSRAMKYGKTSNWISWIEIIDSNGNFHRKTTTELSDFCGMEGITGVIVKAGLRLSEKKQRTASIFSTENYEEILQKVKDLKRNPNISAIEFLDKTISNWLELGEKYNLIIEYESNEGNLKNQDYNKIMSLRDECYPLLAEKEFIIIEDPKIITDKSDKLISWLEQNKVPVFSHISVGIFHPCFSKKQKELIKDLMQFIKKSSGQISGEHGIGLIKKEFIDPNDKKILLNIKNRTDKENKFNKGKIL